jgi:hypothetical protein
MRPPAVLRQVVRLVLVAALPLVMGATGVQYAQAAPLPTRSMGVAGDRSYAAVQPGTGPTTPPIMPDPGNMVKPPLLSLAFDQKWTPSPTQTQWLYKVTNGGPSPASNVAFLYTYQDTHAGAPVLRSGNFTIAKVAGGATLTVAVTCDEPVVYCHDSTLAIAPGNYQIASGAGKTSAP